MTTFHLWINGHYKGVRYASAGFYERLVRYSMSTLLIDIRTEIVLGVNRENRVREVQNDG